MWEWFLSLGAGPQIVLFGMCAAGAGKIWLMVVEWWRATRTDEENEAIRMRELESRDRGSLLDRIAALETEAAERKAEVSALRQANDRQQREINEMIRDFGIMLGIVNTIRLCQQADCPTITALTRNGSIGWLDKQIQLRSNGRGT